MSLSEKIDSAAERLGWVARETHHVVCSAESCTGGMVAEAITAVSGSSGWFEGAWVVYTPEAKTRQLDVDARLIATHGVVSEPVASAMAAGALAHSVGATLSVSLTGVAGPTGGTKETPVGTVCIGWAHRFNEHIVTYARTYFFEGTRQGVRQWATLRAIEGLEALMENKNPLEMG